MKNRSDMIIAVLVIFCLTAMVFTILPVSSSGAWPYNPWWDITDDGKIDINDIARVSAAFGSTGQNISKAGLLYDSGWINVTWEIGQNYTITHGLNLSCADLIVDARGREMRGWSKTYGGTGLDCAWALVQTGDGGYAIAGSTDSYGAGSDDFWLVKTDASGNAQWNKTYEGIHGSARTLVQTSDGGYALAGGSWLVKTDAAGNICVESGLAWVDSTADTITLYRGATDAYWNFVRVRVWQPKQTP